MDLSAVAFTTHDLADDFDAVKIRAAKGSFDTVTPQRLEKIRKLCKWAKDRIQTLNVMLQSFKPDMTPAQTKYADCLVRSVKALSDSFSAHLEVALILCKGKSDKTSLLKQLKARDEYSQLATEYRRLARKLSILETKMTDR